MLKQRRTDKQARKEMRQITAELKPYADMANGNA